MKEFWRKLRLKLLAIKREGPAWFGIIAFLFWIPAVIVAWVFNVQGWYIPVIAALVNAAYAIGLAELFDKYKAGRG